MVFSSYLFIFIFLPITLGGYYLLSKVKNSIWQKLFLIVASLVFYGYSNIYYLLLIVLSILVNYIIALVMQRLQSQGAVKRAVLSLAVGILFNVCLLGYFKYYDFFISNINALFRSEFNLLHLALPLGISFFTFQQLSFLISVYRKEESIGRLIEYASFVLFFPQLVAGPVVLYSEMIPQFKDPARRYFQSENMAKGLYIFSIGLFKKLAIADTLAVFVANGFEDGALSMAAAWATSLCYTFQIYFDFSGYSDMAIGLGLMFNICIPENFNSPYLSESATVFWRRWHMTLGRALSTYVYKPLGGNRKGNVRTYINLFATFVVSGIWHGAQWTFVLWGALYGLWVVLERILKKPLEKLPHLLRVFLTFIGVNLLWVLFRAESFDQAFTLYRSMFNFDNIGLMQIAKIGQDGIIGFPSIVFFAYVTFFLLVCAYLAFFCPNSNEKLRRFQPTNKTMYFTVILFVISLLHLSRESVFIYFNF